MKKRGFKPSRHLDRRRRSLSDPDSVRELVYRLQEGIYITNQKGEILDANPAMLEICGASSLKQLQKLKATDLVDPEMRRREMELLKRKGSVQKFELQIKRPDGQVDIVIGTHRLLSPDVAFKDLGLVIIDEEQRFGVRHKEHLKHLRAVVDLLTLTATPIPRTLSMALMGARAISVIDTPPQQRLAIQTVVTEARDVVIREALARELARGGQVFAVYPWVQGVEKLARRLQGLAPAARVQVAHGQMPSRALERAMLAFMQQRVDVLVSTAIIESGIDIPNANTLLVFRAEQFGLADLYQLRGRVGRFTRQAYAYLFTEPGAILTQDAEKRVDAIQKYSGLGAGFHIALEDLQLRGAGNLLGTEQHGHICAVGFDLYCRLLKSEVDRLAKPSAPVL